jgi:hypothetical protein
LACVLKMLFQFFLLFKTCVSLELFTLKLCKSESVCNRVQLVWQTTVIIKWTPAHALKHSLARTYAPWRYNLIWVALGEIFVAAMTNQSIPFLNSWRACSQTQNTLRQKAANSHDSMFRQHKWRRSRPLASIAMYLGLCSFCILRSLGWYSTTDVSVPYRCCSETSVTNYQPTPRHIPEERRPWCSAIVNSCYDFHTGTIFFSPWELVVVWSV